MAQFYTLLTAIGQAKLANAVALGNTIALTHLAVGDGGGSVPTPDSDRTSLINEVRRAPINRVEVDADNPNWIVVEQVMPPYVGGWTIREIGVFDAAGDLVAYGNYPETYKPTLDEGSGRTQTVRMVLQVSDTAAVTLRVDPSVVLATREYVDTQRAEHEAGRAHPLATDTERGMVIKATQAEVDAGDDDGKFITSAKLKNWVKQATEAVAGLLKVATQEQVDAGEDDATAVTPKKLRWGASYSKGSSGYIIFPSWLGGIIFQWTRPSNSSSIASGSTADIPFSWPIAFPNNVHAAVTNLTNTMYGGKGGNTYAYTLGRTGGNIYAYNDGNSTWNSAAVFIFGVGS
jgi:phage-related tail fiber protein